MSPIVARAAIRTASRRNFSLMSHMRAMARSMEPHPFQRLPISAKPQAADWSKLIKRSGKSALIYFPGMAMILGWPLASQMALNGRV